MSADGGGAVVSPYAHLMGFEVLEQRPGHCRLACAVRDHHRNRRGPVHGGVLLGLIDHAASLADAWTEPGAAPRLSATIDLDCRFTAPVTGDRVVATARIVSEGRAIFFASTEVHDGAGVLVAYGSSTHKRLLNKEKP